MVEMVWVEKRRAIELLHRVGIKDHRDITLSNELTKAKDKSYDRNGCRNHP